jgi:hypothetical protein
MQVLVTPLDILCHRFVVGEVSLRLLLVPPHAHAISHNPIDHGDVMRPLRCPMRDPHQRVFALFPVCSHGYTIIIVRYVLAWALQELLVYSWRERPRWAARGGRLVRWKLEADENTVGRE